MTRLGLFALAATFIAAPVFAQQRPLVTEDPETIGAGRLLLEAGVDYLRDVTYPASGLAGNLVGFPAIGASIGVGSIAELQIDGTLWTELSITDRRTALLSGLVDAGESTSTISDVEVATKVRLLAETVGRPAAALRFGTKLPAASQESGLGLGTIDFAASLLLAKTVQSVRIVGNAGVGLLPHPVGPHSPDNVLVYGLSFARALTNAAEVVGEVHGRYNGRDNAEVSGTDSRSVFRFGARYTYRMLRIDAAMLFGLTARDQAFGLTAGFTYVFNAFQTP